MLNKSIQPHAIDSQGPRKRFVVYMEGSRVEKSVAVRLANEGKGSSFGSARSTPPPGRKPSSKTQPTPIITSKSSTTHSTGIVRLENCSVIQEQALDTNGRTQHVSSRTQTILQNSASPHNNIQEFGETFHRHFQARELLSDTRTGPRHERQNAARLLQAANHPPRLSQPP